MNILEANNNILREAEYTLKIINGENAEVYTGGPTFFFPNKDLNAFGYWNDFLNTTDSMTIPIISIGSMTKTQSIWYRNVKTLDSLNIEVDHDYNNNIMEFLNKGIKNAFLDYDSIEQLIFIVEITFINSVGYSTKKTLFVGRPTLKNDSTSRLSFELNNLDSIIKDAKFETTVLQANTDSFFNFISLKRAFEAIYNSPHSLNDEFVYPVCPFDIDTTNYLPDTGITYKDIDHIPEGATVYAEDTIVGREGYIQSFFYANQPECGISTKNINNITETETDYVSNWTFFTNQDDINNILLENVRKPHNNAFRMFRPIRTFISNVVNNNMQVAVALSEPTSFSSPYLGLINANTDEYRVNIGDEIVVCEQMMDFAMLKSGSIFYASRIILFNDLSNIYYYNKTQDIFYWNIIVQGATTLPLPKQWYDMESYLNTGALLRYDINYQMTEDYSSAFATYNNGYNNVTYTNNNFSYWQFDAVNHIRRDNNCNTNVNSNTRGTPLINQAVEPRLLPAWNASIDGISTQRYIETDRASMEACLDEIYSVCTLKTVRITEGLDILWGFDNGYSQHYFSYEANNTKTTNRKSVFNLNNGVFDYDERDFYQHQDIGYCWDYELSENFGENQVMLSMSALQSAQTHYTTLAVQYGRTSNYGELSIYKITSIPQINNNLSILNDFCYIKINKNLFYGDPFIDKFVLNDATYPIFGKTIYKKYIGEIFNILDINIGLNQMIVNNDGLIEYLDIDTLASFYTDTLSLNTSYLFAITREDVRFTDTSNMVKFHYINGEVNEDIRLLGFSGSRYDASVGLANSFFKNMYSDNLGVKKIGFAQPNIFTLTDDMMKEINVKTYNFNKLEYAKYDIVKNDFTNIDKDIADTKEQDDQNYDKSLSINLYSNIDTDIDISIKRIPIGIEITANNNFVTNLQFSFTPPNYSSFDIDFTGHSDSNGKSIEGLIVRATFYDADLGISEVFRAKIVRRKLENSGVKDEIVGASSKLIWKDDKIMGLKFPFLYNKYSSFFKDRMSDYFIDSSGNVRKLMIVTVKIDELLLFNESYSVFNIGERRVLIDSKEKYLNGYGFIGDSLVPFNDNRAVFYIEKSVSNFNSKTTTLTLVSI